MGTLGILSLIFSVIMTGAGIAATAYQNKQNAELQVSNREDEQQFAHEEAELARQANIDQYNQLYSPAAKVSQYESAGLSPALMYSNGAAQGAAGLTTQMANSPSHAAPYMNPLLNLNGNDPFQQALQTETKKEEIKRTRAEAENIQHNTQWIDQQVKESDKRIEEIEAEINNKNVSTANDELRGKLLENELKISNATYDEQIKIIEKNAELIEANIEKTRKEIDILKIDESKRNEFLEAEIAKMKAEKAKYVADAMLAASEKKLNEIKYKLTQSEININLKQREKLLQEIEEKEIELGKLRENRLWGEKNFDRVTGLAMEFGKNFQQWCARNDQFLMDLEKNAGKKAHDAMDKWWNNNEHKFKEMWNGNWVPYLNDFFMPRH